MRLTLSTTYILLGIFKRNITLKNLTNRSIVLLLLWIIEYHEKVKIKKYSQFLF